MTHGVDLTDLARKVQAQTLSEAAQALAGRTPQEVEYVLARLPEAQGLAIASYLADGAGPHTADSDTAMAGVEEFVEELLSPIPAALPVDCTAAEAIAFMVKAKDVSDITYIYVTAAQRLVGVVAMRDLILAGPSQTLSQIMTAEPYAFTGDTPIREAIAEAMHRHYRMYPVVDENQQMVGVVRAWKLYERIASEISAQAGAQYGVSREEQIGTSVLAAFRMRHPWLQVNLLTAFAAAFVVGMFENTITQMVALAAFLPVLAGQSGNTGCQAMAITLRGMTLGQLADYSVRDLLRKEILLGALNGLLVGVVAGVAMFGYATMSDSARPLMLGVVVLVAMIGACVGSGVLGVLVPLTLKRLGADPATASSIFLTTFTDIMGMGLMLFLATGLIM
ncbi:MAG: magnesium transporter [Immundisolibacter sp.]|uniref:magnesium transporter n=1 Tax=Immundisolibacter sp. TaxID=1934948 RepID=UPI003EE0F97E